jgi:hypothetical protein
MNARFWIYCNDGPAKLTLKPNQELRWYWGAPTDEGWSSESITWEWDGEMLTRHWEQAGRDCDGVLRTSGSDYCPKADLQAGDDPYLFETDNPETWQGVRWPAWRKVARRRYDQFAEAMGY